MSDWGLDIAAPNAKRAYAAPYKHILCHRMELRPVLSHESGAKGNVRQCVRFEGFIRTRGIIDRDKAIGNDIL